MKMGTKIKERWNRQRWFSALMSFMVVLALFSGAVPGTVHMAHADDLNPGECGGCGEWSPIRCPTCDYGSLCNDCLEDIHCQNNVDHCINIAKDMCYDCWMCDECVTLCTECGKCDNCQELCPNPECSVCDACSNVLECNQHCDSCADVCSDCGVSCLACDTDSCPNCDTCSECSVVCNGCEYFCTACRDFCPNCNEICEECGDFCEECGYCITCCEAIDDCDNSECPNCQSRDGFICPNCEEFCDECGYICPDCEEVCNECTEFCEECNLCIICCEYNDECNQDECPSCQSTWGDLCKSCGDYCSECSFNFCYVCLFNDDFHCDDCSEVCDDCGYCEDHCYCSEDDDIGRISVYPLPKFSYQRVGYSPVTPESVVVYNTGTVPTGPLTVTLSGTHSARFTLSTSSLATIGTGGSAGFFVNPNDDLPVGTHRATVTISGADIETSFPLMFTVIGAPAEDSCPSCGSNAGAICGGCGDFCNRCPGVTVCEWDFNACSVCSTLCTGCGECEDCLETHRDTTLCQDCDCGHCLNCCVSSNCDCDAGGCPNCHSTNGIICGGCGDFCSECLGVKICEWDHNACSVCSVLCTSCGVCEDCLENDFLDTTLCQDCNCGHCLDCCDTSGCNCDAGGCPNCRSTDGTLCGGCGNYCSECSGVTLCGANYDACSECSTLCTHCEICVDCMNISSSTTICQDCNCGHCLLCCNDLGCSCDTGGCPSCRSTNGIICGGCGDFCSECPGVKVCAEDFDACSECSILCTNCEVCEDCLGTYSGTTLCQGCNCGHCLDCCVLLDCDTGGSTPDDVTDGNTGGNKGSKTGGATLGGSTPGGSTPGGSTSGDSTPGSTLGDSTPDDSTPDDSTPGNSRNVMLWLLLGIVFIIVLGGLLMIRKRTK